jgi:aminocarboxymuconate-semialdehyde decarboxylase
VAGHPDRFVGLGTVPLQDVDATLLELDVIARDFGFPGIEICTNVNGTDFDDPRFLPFFQRARDLDLTIVVHPNGFSDGERLAAYYLINTVGMPLDSTVFLARTILGGVYERVPGLKVVVVHGGGYLPSYPARYDHAWRMRSDVRNGTSEPPSTYLRQLYYDTMVFDPFDLSILIQRYGADHVLLGTDYPYDMGEVDPVGLVLSVEDISDEDRRAILGGNAARLLRLDGLGSNAVVADTSAGIG